MTYAPVARAAAWLSVFVAIGSALACGPAREHDDRPDVIVIVIDTLRADRLSFYGHTLETAPFLASLAREGLVFERAFSSSSWTAPATASIFTGLHPNEHGVRSGLRMRMRHAAEDDGPKPTRIPDDLDTLPVLMKRLGYRTFGATANPNINSRLGFTRGFDFFVPFGKKGGKSADGLVDAVLAWREDLASDGPFFLYLHLADPHGPYRRHARFIAGDTPPPKNPMDDILAYDSEIRFADEQLRRLFETPGLADDAIVVFTADHGQEFMDHGRRGHGWQLYSELTQVPLFIHHPADPRVRGRSDAIVSNIHIMATLLDLIGETDAEGRGHSLLARPSTERPAFSMRTRVKKGETGHLYSVVSGRFKLILHEPQQETELYDLEADPDEKRNIADANPEVVSELRALVDTQRRRAERVRRGDSEETTFEVDPEVIRALEVFGYGEGGINAGDERE